MTMKLSKDNEITELNIDKPFEKLIENPYNISIFTKALDFNLTLVDKDTKSRTLLFQKEYTDEKGRNILCSYIFIQVINKLCSAKEFENYKRLLDEIVREYSQGDYLEIEPVIFANNYDEDVKTFIKDYNRIEHRKPYKLVLFKT